MADDDGGAVNIGVIYGSIWKGGDGAWRPVRAHVALRSMQAHGSPSPIWGRGGGHVTAVYSDDKGFYAINFLWDATSPDMMNSRYRLFAIERSGQAHGDAWGNLEAHLNVGVLTERVLASALQSGALLAGRAVNNLKAFRAEAKSKGYALHPLKLFHKKAFGETAHKGAAALDQSVGTTFGPELYAAVGHTDVFLE